MEKKTLKDRLNVAGRWVLGGILGWSLAYGAAKIGAEAYADIKINNLEVPEIYHLLPVENSERKSPVFENKEPNLFIKNPESDMLERVVEPKYKLEETEEYKDYLERVEDIKKGVNGNSWKILFAIKGLGYLGGAIGGGFYYSRHRRRKKEGADKN